MPSVSRNCSMTSSPCTASKELTRASTDADARVELEIAALLAWLTSHSPNGQDLEDF